MDPNIILSEQDIEKLIAAHDGDMALVYLYCRCRGVSGEDAARDLCMTAAAVEAAEEKLLRLGLTLDRAGTSAASPASPVKPAPKKGRVILEPAEERPSYSSDDITKRAAEDEAFQTVIYEAQQVMGRMLNSNDMKILFGIYDYLGLPAEVIMVLMNYCVQRYEDLKGEGRKPTFRYIEKEASRWVKDGITSLDEADSYIVRKKELDGQLRRAAEVLDIRDRDLTDTETNYIRSWLEMGFDMEMLREAFDRTVTNTGKRAWSYMNTIMESWRDKGIFSPKDIQEKDRPAASRKTKPSRPAGEQKSKKDSLEKIMKKLDRERGDST